MSTWPSVKAKVVLKALKRIGWRVKRHVASSHVILEREGWPDYTFPFHGGKEVGPAMLAKVARKTGLSPEDL